MILDSFNDEEWIHKAACKNADPEIFFPPRDKVLYTKIAIQAKVYCNGPKGNTPCPVRAECLWYAITDDAQHGIFGGLSHRERNAMVRKWQREFSSKMTLKEYIFKERENKYGRQV
jgi:WhiB family redox-sensing transcriptional regulator